MASASFEQTAAAFGGGHALPRGKCLARSRDRPIHIWMVASETSARAVVVRIEDGDAPPFDAVDEIAADEKPGFDRLGFSRLRRLLQGGCCAHGTPGAVGILLVEGPRGEQRYRVGNPESRVGVSSAGVSRVVGRPVVPRKLLRRAGRPDFVMARPAIRSDWRGL